MTNGINIEVTWSDEDVIEVIFSCSNGYFSGHAEIYLSHAHLLELAGALSGFPSHTSDSRKVEVGTFDAIHADGGARMNFYCLDAVGHAALEVQLRGNACKALGEFESVALRLPVEAAGVDSFVRQLKTIDGTFGGGALLPMANDPRLALAIFTLCLEANTNPSC